MSNDRLIPSSMPSSNKSAHIFAPQCLDRKQPVGMQSQSGQRWSQVIRTCVPTPAQSFSPVLNHVHGHCLEVPLLSKKIGRRHALYLRGLSPQLNVEKQKNSISCARAVTAILQTAKEKLGGKKLARQGEKICYLGGASK